MTSEAGRRQTLGLERLRELLGESGETLVDRLSEASPDLARYVVEFAFGDVYGRGDLSVRDRQLVTLAILITLGDSEPQLRAHVQGARSTGLSPRQILGVAVQAAVYAGFPRAINGAIALSSILNELGEPVEQLGD